MLNLILFISGEVPDLERSVSSTKPHTVNVFNEEEPPLTVHVLMKNSTEVDIEELPTTEIRPGQSDRSHNVV